MKIEIKLIPDGMDLSKAIQDGMPVEKMEEACPIATRDAEVNEDSKRHAIKDHQYGPAVDQNKAVALVRYLTSQNTCKSVWKMTQVKLDIVSC